MKLSDVPPLTDEELERLRYRAPHGHAHSLNDLDYGCDVGWCAEFDRRARTRFDRLNAAGRIIRCGYVWAADFHAFDPKTGTVKTATHYLDRPRMLAEKDAHRWRPAGIVVAVRIKSPGPEGGLGTIGIGYSFCNPCDRWNRRIGRDIAVERALRLSFVPWLYAEYDYAAQRTSRMAAASLVAKHLIAYAERHAKPKGTA